MTIFNYAVNYVDLIIVALFALTAFAGYRTGIFATIINFIRVSVGTFLCFYFSSHLAQFVYESSVKPKILNEINQNVLNTSNADEILFNLQAYADKLPTFFTKNLDFSAISLTGDDIANTILSTYFEPILLAFTRAAIFLIVFILFFGATGIIMAIINRRNKRSDKKEKTPLRKADKILGCIFGLVKAAVIVLALSSVLMYLTDIDAINTYPFVKAVESSTLVQLINEINPFNAITEGLI